MEFKDIPEPFKKRIEDNLSEMDPYIRDLVETSIETCPDWVSAQDCIWNSIQCLIDQAIKVQTFTHKE